MSYYLEDFPKLQAQTLADFKGLLIVIIRLETVYENWASRGRWQPEEAGILQLVFSSMLDFEGFYPMLS